MLRVPSGVVLGSIFASISDNAAIDFIFMYGTFGIGAGALLKSARFMKVRTAPKQEHVLSDFTTSGTHAGMICYLPFRILFSVLLLYQAHTYKMAPLRASISF